MVDRRVGWERAVGPVGGALLVLGAVVLGAFAVFATARAPASVRTVLRVGAASSWSLVVGSVYGVYDAFNPPGGSALLSTWREVATAAPRTAALVLAVSGAWLARRALASWSEPVPAPGDRSPAPVDLAP